MQGECRGKRVSLLTLRPCRAAACLCETKIVRTAHTARHHPPHRARRPCTKPVTRREKPSDTVQKLRTVGGQSKYASCEYINETSEYINASCVYTFATCVYTSCTMPDNFASYPGRLYVLSRHSLLPHPGGAASGHRAARCAGDSQQDKGGSRGIIPRLPPTAIECGPYRR